MVGEEAGQAQKLSWLYWTTYYRVPKARFTWFSMHWMNARSFQAAERESRFYR